MEITVLRTLRSFAVVVSLIFANQAYGQSEISVPADAKFVVQLDVDAFRHTNLGSRLLELTQRMAEQEFDGNGEQMMQKVEESLGFNPLEEIHTLTIIGSDFEDPQENVRAMLQLGKTTGNLEGLMLALPGYSSEEYDDYTIHSAENGDMHAYAAIHTAGNGDKRIVAACQREELIAMMKGADAGSRSNKRRGISWSVPEGTFAQVQLLEFPEEILDEDPPGNIIKLLTDVSILVSEQDGNFLTDLRLTTTDKKRAEQIQQLAMGMKAMVGLFQEKIEDELGDDAELAVQMIDNVQVELDGSTVAIQVGIPEALLIKFLQEEADLPL